MSTITTHVLNTSAGRPARGVPVTLELLAKGKWRRLAENKTNSDGRVPDLLPYGHTLSRGVYRISFDTGNYFRTAGKKAFYPVVTVTFKIENPKEHYHIPLLLNPFGYSTYRGS